MVKQLKGSGKAIDEVNRVDSSCCRICQTISKEVLVSACNCRGSLRFVHQSCLQEWVNATNRTSCELCCFQYRVVQAKRYKCCRSVWVWSRHPMIRAHLRTEFIFMAILTGITIIITCFCYFLLMSGKTRNETWSKVIVYLILGIVFFWYFKEMFMLIKANVQHWMNWWRSCIMIKIVIEDRKSLTQPAKNTFVKAISTTHVTSVENTFQTIDVKQKTISKSDDSEVTCGQSEHEISENPQQMSSYISSTNNNSGIVMNIEKELKTINSRDSGNVQQNIPGSIQSKAQTSCILDNSKKYDVPTPNVEQEAMLCCVVLDAAEID